MISVHDPADGTLIGPVPRLKQPHVAEVAQRGRAAQAEWHAFGFAIRGDVFRRARRWLLWTQCRR